MKKHQKTVTSCGELTRNWSIRQFPGVVEMLYILTGFQVTDTCIFLKIMYCTFQMCTFPYVNLAPQKKLTTKFELKKIIGLNVTLTKECVSQVKNKSHYFQKKNSKYFTMMRCVYC